jgi:hypothetical protein
MKTMEFSLHVLREMQNASHDIVRGHEAVSVKGVYDTLVGLTELAVTSNTTQHEYAKVVRVDSR